MVNCRGEEKGDEQRWDGITGSKLTTFATRYYDMIRSFPVIAAAIFIICDKRCT